MKQTGTDIQPVRYDMCCGIAGTFGFKKGTEGYEVSMAIGERLFKRIRAMNVDLVVTESGSKMQIEHGTSIRVLHPATVLWDAYTTPLNRRGSASMTCRSLASGWGRSLSRWDVAEFVGHSRTRDCRQDCVFRDGVKSLREEDKVGMQPLWSSLCRM